MEDSRRFRVVPDRPSERPLNTAATAPFASLSREAPSRHRRAPSELGDSKAMLGLVPLWVVSQLLVPPEGQPAFTYGSSLNQAYRGQSVSVAARGASSADAVWLDSRRSLGRNESPPKEDLWVAFVTSGTLVTRLLEVCPPASAFRSPRIAANGVQRAIVWIEDGLQPRVKLRRWVGPVEATGTTWSGMTAAVAVAAYQSGFVVARLDSQGVTIDFVGSNSTVPAFAIPLSNGSDVEIAESRDGGLIIGAQTPVGAQRTRPLGGPPYVWSGPNDTRLAGLSPAQEGIIAFEPASPNVTLHPGATFSLVREASVLKAVGGPSAIAYAYTTDAGSAFVGFNPSGGHPDVQIPDGLASSVDTLLLQNVAGLSGTPAAMVFFDQTVVGPRSSRLELSTGPVVSRTPSVAWHEPLGAFAIGWTELRPSGLIGTVAFLAVDGGLPPVSGSTFIGPVGTTRVQLLQLDAMTAGYAAGGAQLVVGELLANGQSGPPRLNLSGNWLPTSGEASFAYMPSVSSFSTTIRRASTTALAPISAPRCAVTHANDLYLAGWKDAMAGPPNLVVVTSNGAIRGPFPLALTGATFGVIREPVCLTRSSSNHLVLTWSDEFGTHVVTVDPSRVEVPIDSLTAAPTHDPVAVEVDGELLMTGEQPAGLRLLLEPSQLVLTETALGAQAAAMAAAPSGTVAVAWQEFDPNVRATRIYARLVVPARDGGTNDGGEDRDGGDGDGGAGDGGDAGDGDAGRVEDGGVAQDGGDDGGERDGGRDAGLLDGGQQLEFMPACACAAGEGSWVVTLAFALVAWRLSRSRAPSR